MRYKKCFFLAAVISAAMLLSGCFGGVEVGDRAFVQIIGIDKRLDIYTVSLQIFQPSGSGAPSSADKNSVCISGDGSDLNSAISACEVKSGNKIFFGHLKSVIFGSGIASPADELNTLIGLRSDFGTLPLSCPVFYSNSPYEVASLTSERGLYSAERLTDLIKSNANFGRTFYVPVSDILNAELHPMGCAVLPEVYTDGNDADFDGAAVINSGLSDIKLTDEQLKGFLIFSDKFQCKSRLVVSTGNNIPVEITDSKSCVSAKNSDGKLLIETKIKLRLKFPENCPDMHQAANEVCTAVRDECISAYSETVWQNGADIFGIYSEVRRSCPELIEYIGEEEFAELLKNSILTVKVSALSA